jgi:type II secretory pathway component PulJ
MSKLSSLKLQGKAGFTFLEMIFSIGIFVLVAAATSAVFNQALRAYRYSNSRMIAVKEGELAMEWIVRDIRPDPSTDKSPSITAYNNDGINGYLTLQTATGESIRYYRQSSSNTIQRQEDGVDSLLAQNVIKLSFACYNANNQVVSNPVGDANVRAVEINIITEQNDQTFHLNSVAQYKPPY